MDLTRVGLTTSIAKEKSFSLMHRSELSVVATHESEKSTEFVTSQITDTRRASRENPKPFAALLDEEITANGNAGDVDDQLLVLDCGRKTVNANVVAHDGFSCDETMRITRQKPDQGC
jgi:hypothetical protein